MPSAELLSRLQFAFTMTAHIIYPSISIGLVLFLVIIEGLWLTTKQTVYHQACLFWGKIFALTFGMGVVSGIVMEFQLGTNWSGFSYRVGPLLGVLFTYEVLSAFFIEAGFLGIMLFGWQKVGKKMHFFSTIMVAIGTTLSAFWILSANSWMQTPQGFSINAEQQFVTNDFMPVIFNPSFLPRFFHMLLSCYVTASMLIMGIACYYLFKRRHQAVATVSLNIAWVMALISLSCQLFVGHEVGAVVDRYQPVKTAAIEAIWQTGPRQPTLLFAWPNTQTEKNDYALGIPGLASFLNKGDWNANMQGLDSVDKQDRPPVFLVFWSFRLMVGAGLAMLFVLMTHLVYRLFGQPIAASPKLLILTMLASPLGLVAIEMGWMTAELGRQPWVVYQWMRTSEAASKVPNTQVLATLIVLFFVYLTVFGFFYFRYLLKTIQHGPLSLEPSHPKNSPFHYMLNHHDQPPPTNETSRKPKD